MTLLEQLVEDHRPELAHVRHGVLYKLILTHFDEIKEARNRGFSWWEITYSAKNAWRKELGDYREDWYRYSIFERYYNQIKKERKHGQ